jgi:hypothetical protein
MEATNITFADRSTHREDQGGYEEWRFSVDGRDFILYCDIRLPGVVASFYEGMPEERDKVCMTDILFITNKTAEDIYDPKQSTEEVQKAVSDAVIKILLEKIKPNRNFKYVTFLYSISNSFFYKDAIFDKICTQGTEEFKQKILRIIRPEVQTLIDAGGVEFVTGPLK